MHDHRPFCPDSNYRCYISSLYVHFDSLCFIIVILYFGLSVRFFLLSRPGSDSNWQWCPRRRDQPGWSDWAWRPECSWRPTMVRWPYRNYRHRHLSPPAFASVRRSQLLRPRRHRLPGPPVFSWWVSRERDTVLFRAAVMWTIRTCVSFS